MKTISVLRLMPTTRDELDSFFKKTKNNILSGSINQVEIAVILKGMEEVVKKLRTDPEIEEYILDEVSKHGKKCNYGGAELSIKDTGVKYDYSVCNDSRWNDLIIDISNLKDKLKERENTLKSHNEEWVNPETGEEILPPIRTAKEKVIVTLSK